MPTLISPELAARGKAAILKFLEVLENDPERVVRGVERAVDGLEQVGRYVRENPEGAKRAARNTALKVVAKVAKKKLNE